MCRYFTFGFPNISVEVILFTCFIGILQTAIAWYSSRFYRDVMIRYDTYKVTSIMIIIISDYYVCCIKFVCKIKYLWNINLFIDEMINYVIMYSRWLWWILFYPKSLKLHSCTASSKRLLVCFRSALFIIIVYEYSSTIIASKLKVNSG